MGHKDNRKRNLSVSFSEEEYAILQERVAASGLMKTKYCRKVLLEGDGIISNTGLDKECRRQISYIGRNLNSAYMAFLKNGASPSILAKFEFALKDINELRTKV